MTHPEQQYLSTIREILESSEEHENRTGVNTYRTLGIMHKYDFSKHGFPLFTTKKVWFKGIKIELLWFLSGNTNIKYLVENGVHIWDDDAFRWHKTLSPDYPHTKEQFIQDVIEQKQYYSLKNGERYMAGDLGSVYGKQWRSWNRCCSLLCSKHQPIDQIQNLIDGLKSNPNSRRHIVSAWNVAELNEMALNPCHVLFQFSVDKGKLWCHVFVRSNDCGLGLPYNVASYSLLTHMIAQVCDLKPGGLIYTAHDAHIYHDHKPILKEQIKRKPYPFPKLWLNPNIKCIDNFKPEDIKIKGYKSHSKLEMALHVG